jgi:homopolymeric O-antigen transport system permease protein
MLAREVAATQELMPAGAGDRVTVIQPARGWASLNLGELWEYRELLYFLVWRDLKIRYKQTAVGAAWVLIQPLLTAAIFTVVFGRYAKLPSGGVPYAVMVYAGLLPWFVFANALTFSTRSIVENQALVTKVYVPRLFLPLVAVLAGLVDFLIGAVFLVALMGWYGIVPPLQVLLLPLLVVFLVATAVAVTLWLSALNVRYRDVQYTVPFLTQAWLFATPVAYSVLVFPEDVRGWIGLNPMAGVVQSFRWALFGEDAGASGQTVLLSLGVVLVLLAGGIEYFRRVERSFADVV